MDPKEAYLSKPWLNHYPEGVPETVHIPNVSVPQLFDEMADKYSNHTALIFYGKKISYREHPDASFGNALGNCWSKDCPRN